MTQYRVKIEDALNWELHGETLRYALTDRADEEFREACLEVDYLIAIRIDHDTDEFVCIPIQVEG